MNCKGCGDPLDPRRAELGYDYCLKNRCQQLYVKRVKLTAVGVNKAADYMGADEVAQPRLPPAQPAEPDEPEDVGSRARAPRRPVRSGQLETTLERLRKLEARLDHNLTGTYELFEQGKITAVEMDRERERLTDAFNRAVTAENIRYRSMLRTRRLQTGVRRSTN